MNESRSQPDLNAIFFWSSYILGTLLMGFSFLLAQAPRPRHGATFTLDYISWSSAATSFVICVLVTSLSWYAKRRVPKVQSAATRLAVIQLAFSIYGILSFASVG